MTDAAFAAENEPARLEVAGFAQPRWRAPVDLMGALQISFVGLLVANVGRIPLISGSGRDASIVLNDVCVTALVFLGIFAAIQKRSLLIDRVALAALLFAGIGLVSAVLAIPRFGLTPVELAISLSYLARWLTYFGLYLLVINSLDRRRALGVWAALESVMLAITIFGIFQALFLPNFTQMIYGRSSSVGWDEQGHRLMSTILEPNIAASMITLVVLVQLARMSLGVATPWWKPVVMLSGLALTISRSGLLAFIIGTMVIVLAHGLSFRLMRFFGALAFIMLGVGPKLISFAASYGKFSFGKGTSAGVRFYAWAVALKTYMEHPVIGVGFNTFGYVKVATGGTATTVSTYSSDGGLLFAAVMTGTLGLIVYCVMLWLVYRRCRQVWTDPGLSAEERGLAIGVAAGIPAMIVHSAFANSIFTTFVMEILWISWALVAVLRRQPRERSTASAATAVMVA